MSCQTCAHIICMLVNTVRNDGRARLLVVPPQACKCLQRLWSSTACRLRDSVWLLSASYVGKPSLMRYKVREVARKAKCPTRLVKMYTLTVVDCNCSERPETCQTLCVARGFQSTVQRQARS